ncbi:hypothetical protein [Ascidiimonas sp. W6]|uniref:hypothetical protein n=1 Tax=Ascidiimonas meishanensis TaxID=3128903 RepID=UPI0030EF0B04
MKMFKKMLFSTLYIALIASVFFSCSKDEDVILNNESSIEVTDYGLETTEDKNIPPEVLKQLTLTQENLDKYTNGALSLVSFEVKGNLSSNKGLEQTFKALSSDNSTVGYGNIMDPTSLQISTVGDIIASQKQEGIQILNNYASKVIKVGQNALELAWNYNGETLKTMAFYNENGIVWDNLLIGLTMQDTAPIVTSENNNDSGEANRVSWKSSTTTWNVNWLWGSKRGSMYFKITIYYSGTYVSNTDMADGAYINIGSAKSESKVLRETGSYGKGQYALGLATPLASVSFNSSQFKVEASGIGSNSVHNGTKSYYP